MRVLLVKLSSFGDVVHTLPALTDLKRARPDVEIDWVVEEAFASIAAAHPAVTEVIPVAVRGSRWPPSRWATFMAGRAKLRRHFRERGYDFVIDAQGLLKSALLARQVGRPVYGYDAASARERAASLLYARRLPVPNGLHAVERTRRLFAAAFDYALPEREGDFGLTDPSRTVPSRAAPAPAWSGAADIAASWRAPDRTEPGVDVPERYGIVIQAASWPSKLWPEDHWWALLDTLAATEDTVIPWGSEAERQRALRLADGRPHVHVLDRRLSGEALMSVLRGARFAIGLDSGLMHLAAALGVPGVWLFGPTDPALTGPYGAHQQVLRSSHVEAPCHRRVCTREPDGLCCMRRIGVEQAFEALDTGNVGRR